jgi:PGF-pre-PGF domain-containing protein/LPXTG-motif cell wall-anchored protein
VDPNKAITLKVDKVVVEVNSDVSSVKITVKESTLPSGANLAISAGAGNIYKYLDISSTVSSGTIAKVKISFKVEKSWVTNNSLDISTIVLQRYVNDQWVKLTTTKVNEDATYYYFEAESPGLSVFAITGAKIGAGTTTTTGTQCPTCPSCSAWAECVNDKQTRTCYTCDASTNYECKSTTETKNCSILSLPGTGVIWSNVIIAVIGLAIILIIIFIIVAKKKKKHNSHNN